MGYPNTLIFVDFPSSDPAATLPDSATLTGGTGTFNATLRTAGVRTITATDALAAAVTGTSNAIAVAALTTFSGPSATGTGVIAATLAGGGPGC